uniref:PAS domain-containing protein n=1 Tax=Calcidiscus leptoporus TaxID=127549 RepID=A0A7S0J3G5_9EUKA
MARWDESVDEGMARSLHTVEEEGECRVVEPMCSWRSELCEKMALSSVAVIVSEARAPGRIVACNAVWSELCGYGADEAIGLTPKILQGKGTSMHKAAHFTEKVCSQTVCTHGEEFGFASRQASSFVKLVNYSKAGRPFVHCLKTWRTRDDGAGVDYFVTESHEESGTAVSRAMLRAAGECDDVPEAREQGRAAASLRVLAVASAVPLLVTWTALQAVAQQMNRLAMPLI